MDQAAPFALAGALGSWQMIAALVVATAAAGFDLAVRRIPNAITYTAALVGLGVPALLADWHGLAGSAAGLALGLAFFALPVLLGGMGMGDLKLMGAIGALIGPRAAFDAAVLSVFAGGILALVFALRQGTARTALKRAVTLRVPVGGPATAPSRAGAPSSRTINQLATVGKIPYGVAIALGVWTCPFIHML